MTENNVEIPKEEEPLGELIIKGLDACKIIPTIDKDGRVHFRSACTKEAQASLVQQKLETLYPGGEGVIFHRTKVVRTE